MQHPTRNEVTIIVNGAPFCNPDDLDRLSIEQDAEDAEPSPVRLQGNRHQRRAAAARTRRSA